MVYIKSIVCLYYDIAIINIRHLFCQALSTTLLRPVGASRSDKKACHPIDLMTYLEVKKTRFRYGAKYIMVTMEGIYNSVYTIFIAQTGVCC